jgi:hypothetical protein
MTVDTNEARRFADTVSQIGSPSTSEIIRQLADELDAARSELASLRAGAKDRPRIVCLCGSTRFMEAWQEANLSETLAGRIVLSIGCNTKSDADLQRLGALSAEKKIELDELHKRKIDLADEILVLNVGGYIGSSTRSEIDYAMKHGKAIRWLEPLPAAPLHPVEGKEGEG